MESGKSSALEDSPSNQSATTTTEVEVLEDAGHGQGAVSVDEDDNAFGQGFVSDRRRDVDQRHASTQTDQTFM